MDEQKLAEIEARAKAATEGPWEIHSIGEDGFEEWFLDMPSRPATMFADGGSITSNRLSPDDQDEANLVFCAAARQDIPDLIAHIREREAVVAAAVERARCDWQEQYVQEDPDGFHARRRVAIDELARLTDPFDDTTGCAADG